MTFWGNNVYGAAGNKLSLGANDSELIRLAPDGNVGIGTTAPSDKLEVNGSFRVNKADDDSVILYDVQFYSTFTTGLTLIRDKFLASP